VHPEHPQPLLVRGGERPQSHHRARHRELVDARQVDQVSPRAGGHHAPAGVDDRPPGARKRLGGEADLLLIATGRRLIARQVDIIDGLVGDIGAAQVRRDIDDHRTGPATAREVKRLMDTYRDADPDASSWAVLAPGKRATLLAPHLHLGRDRRLGELELLATNDADRVVQLDDAPASRALTSQLLGVVAVEHRAHQADERDTERHQKPHEKRAALDAAYDPAGQAKEEQDDEQAETAGGHEWSLQQRVQGPEHRDHRNESDDDEEDTEDEVQRDVDDESGNSEDDQPGRGLAQHRGPLGTLLHLS
jgi:hypothetical protein